MQVSLYALVMLFGALVAGIGLVLLFRKQEHSVSRIKIGNQEIQFSAPGLVVVLIGGVLIVLLPVLHVDDRPIFVIGSHRPDNEPVSGWEHEPNDSFREANVIKFPTTIKGSIGRRDSEDFFKFQLPTNLTEGRVSIDVFLEPAGSLYGAVTAYDKDEQQVESRQASSDEAVHFSFRATPGEYYYLKVFSVIGNEGEYALTLKQGNP